MKTLIITLSVSFLSFAQYLNVRVDSPTSNQPEEVSIAINTLNPNHISAGANINHFFRSSDGGYNWNTSFLTSSFGVWGDPVVVYDELGYLYYGHLSNPPFPGYWIDRIVIQRSTDNGLSWNDGAGIGFLSPKNQDKEWIAVDMHSNLFKGNVYVCWTEFDNYGSSNSNDSSRIKFSRSTDKGLTWSNAITISDQSGDCIDSDNTVEGAVPCVGPNGEIYVSWAGPLGLVFDKSTDGGLTWGTDIFVSDIPGGWDFDVSGIYRCNGLPITACDTSQSPYRGNIYINWSDQRNGTNNTDVFFVKSTDGGNTWSSPLKVNDDNSNRHQFFTWMTIDQTTGAIYIVFYDRRNTTGDATDVYVARSTNGGESFTNFKVSQSSFTPSSNIFFGDYTNIAAFNKKVYPIWMRLDGSTLSVWTAVINDSLVFVPVELESFTASKLDDRKVFLSWQTASELNNRGFEVQRKFFNSDFVSIGFVDGKGTTSEKQYYNFTDTPFEDGLYSYRLKQIDFDGKIQFSNEVEINLQTVSHLVLEQNFPNPFNNRTALRFATADSRWITLKLYDMLGREVLIVVNEILEPGLYEKEINFSEYNFPTGMYFYELNDGRSTIVKKLIYLK
ncbi:BNR/Asp-box repeat protein [Ignavibacterium album JCM 16511]|uniref:BNR/Asp-box repeat protein n=1 Tax=Ignavibacterium album (strain DSM 19864 / JCM 16511 / NBRC 101810 / Mat9-16) TaxID=945713 RepID=I0ALL1_IGNAJ|nr:T9SS type A sorting domain-containing protein [Ignavibacterium album]AFH49868.1 BNR/Asp-box repeat protein [Ignavibacterium album JCM 16511]